jgi:hypothetical protein
MITYAKASFGLPAVERGGTPVMLHPPVGTDGDRTGVVLGQPGMTLLVALEVRKPLGDLGVSVASGGERKGLDNRPAMVPMYQHVVGPPTREVLLFGSMRINEFQPADVREWVADLKAAGTSPPVIRQCHTILSAVFTTAFNDQITRLHPCRGVKTPPVPKKLRTIITPEQFDQLYTALPTQPGRLLAELLIESGMRWAELIELRPTDLNLRMRTLTVSRVCRRTRRTVPSHR